MTPAEAIAAIKRLVDEKENLRTDLQRYGDHTLSCLAASTDRFVLSFSGIWDEHWQPGDYCGPITGYTGDSPVAASVRHGFGTLRGRIHYIRRNSMTSLCGKRVTFLTDTPVDCQRCLEQILIMQS